MDFGTFLVLAALVVFGFGFMCWLIDVLIWFFTPYYHYFWSFFK